FAVIATVACPNVAERGAEREAVARPSVALHFAETGQPKIVERDGRKWTDLVGARAFVGWTPSSAASDFEDNVIVATWLPGRKGIPRRRFVGDNRRRQKWQRQQD